MKVTKYRKAENQGALLAYFSIIFKNEYGGFFINDMKLFQKNGNRFFAMPDRKYENEHGETKYAPYCGYADREVNEKFRVDVLKAIEAFALEESMKVPPLQINSIPADPYANLGQSGEPTPTAYKEQELELPF